MYKIMISDTGHLRNNKNNFPLSYCSTFPVFLSSKFILQQNLDFMVFL
jgi:hypothetical protein